MVTVALEMANLRVSGVQNDDEVFVPALTFVGYRECLYYMSNGVPHFV